MRSPGDRSRASRPGASLGRLLIASVVAVDLFVVGLVAAAMQHGLREHRALAVVTGENLARLANTITPDVMSRFGGPRIRRVATT